MRKAKVLAPETGIMKKTRLASRSSVMSSLSPRSYARVRPEVTETVASRGNRAG